MALILTLALLLLFWEIRTAQTMLDTRFIAAYLLTSYSQHYGQIYSIELLVKMSERGEP
jgi:hypothetical protein